MQITSQDIFSEKSNGIAEGSFAKLPNPCPEPMKTPDNPLQDYVLKVMKENSLSYPDVEKMARKRGGTIGKSSIQSIAKGETPNPGINTLVELAWGLSRPVDEVIAAALGIPVSESNSFKKSDFGNLADLYQQLPNGEQRAFKRYLQIMEREMRRILMLQDDVNQL